mmetsp:Transcript_1860/g.2130  ORF Transcript_1860/g.2130 Transcript_1860/m.2130 type:complete len:536 (+) Transcript_1860:121-1728(+)
MAAYAPDNKSRYKTAGAEFDGQIEPEDAKQLVADLRKAFASDKTRSKRWRVQQLKAFDRMLDECRAEFCEAMFQDLHKHKFEGYVTEISLIKSEIHECLKNLDKWMAPTKKPNTLLNIPCWSSTQRDPLGVVLVMGAWNYPIQLSLAPMVGAIAAGNCIIMKPGSYAKASSNAMARLVNKYLDPDCIRVVEGNRKVTGALLEEKFDKIFFTGSGYVGRIIATAAAKHLTPCALELGGKSPCIVDSSANLTHAAERIAWGSFLNGGQTCVRPDFLMVQESVADEFIDVFRATVKKFYGEDPQKTEFFGRCINDSAFNRLADLVEAHKDNIVFGGRKDASEKYIEPTMFDFGSDIEAFSKQEVMQDEIFGPLFPTVRYKNTEEVIQFVRNLPTGKPLALYAFGTDSNFIKSIKTRTTSGGLCINDTIMHLSNHHIPFGGVGSSGMGSYHGKYSFDCFSHEKAVLEKSPFLDENILFKYMLSCRFPPYDSTKQMLIGIAGNPMLEPLINYPIPMLRNLAKLLLVYLVLRLFGYRLTSA